jgi:hypothetical protein
MLSFIYQLVQEYEREHGYRPNVLYLNHAHFAGLRGDLAEIRNLGAMSQLLGMEIVLDPELTQPHVYWTTIDWLHAVAV